MLFVVVLATLFYAWSFLPKKAARLHRLSRIATILLSTGLIAHTATLGQFTLPAFWQVAKYMIFAGLAGAILLRSKESRYMQVAILISVVATAIYWSRLEMPAHAGDKVKTRMDVDELLCAIDGDPSNIALSHGVELTQVVSDQDTGDMYPLQTIYSVDIDDSMDVGKMMAALDKDPQVIWVEYNDQHGLQWTASSVVTDPKVTDQWAWSYLDMDDYHRALRQISPTRPAKLFIIDSGSEASHEDLVEGYVSYSLEADIDDNGHGTHCAGVAAATTDNGIGVASFSPGREWVEVSGLKVINALGFAPQSAIISAIQDAVDEGADVISLSLGAYSNDPEEHAYNEVLQYAHSQGVIVVAAAGNSSRSAAAHVPSGCKHVVSVAAIDKGGSLASFSNTNDEVQMGLAAPGVDIVSTFRRNTYKQTSGTSMAAPMVAGLAAVCKAIDPEMSPDQYYEIVASAGIDSDKPLMSGKVINPAKTIDVAIEMIPASYVE